LELILMLAMNFRLSSNVKNRQVFRVSPVPQGLARSLYVSGLRVEIGNSMGQVVVTTS
jgi:hypothetical protein